MTSPATPTTQALCSLCGENPSGGECDVLAEFVFGLAEQSMPVCDDCAEHLRDEPFDHKDWS